MSTKPIILNESNILDTTRKNVLTLTFPQQLTISSKTEIALLSCFVNYSWFNITTAFNNKTLSYYWPTDASTNVVTFPDVFFLISDISNYIQDEMLANGHYLVDDNGDNVFYFKIQSNYTVYGTTATFTPLPSVLPDGWSNPGGLDLSVPNALTPQLIFSSNNTGKLIGFEASTSYPTTAQTAITLINSPLVPQISPVTACMIACNMVNSPNFNQFGNIIQTFTPKVTFGSQIIIEPPQSIWYQCIGGTYPKIELTFYDQNLNPLVINDPAIVMTLIVKDNQK